MSIDQLQGIMSLPQPPNQEYTALIPKGMGDAPSGISSYEKEVSTTGLTSLFNTLSSCVSKLLECFCPLIDEYIYAQEHAVQDTLDQLSTIINRSEQNQG